MSKLPKTLYLENKELTKSLLPIVRKYQGRWRYLRELQEIVASETGHAITDRDFTCSVYCAGIVADKEALDGRAKSLGLLRTTPELLRQLAGKRTRTLRGVGGLLGERVETGTIKPDGTGGYLFFPGRKRRRECGFYPDFIGTV